MHIMTRHDFLAWTEYCLADTPDFLLYIYAPSCSRESEQESGGAAIACREGKQLLFANFVFVKDSIMEFIGVWV